MSSAISAPAAPAASVGERVVYAAQPADSRVPRCARSASTDGGTCGALGCAGLGANLPSARRAAHAQCGSSWERWEQRISRRNITVQPLASPSPHGAHACRVLLGAWPMAMPPCHSMPEASFACAFLTRAQCAWYAHCGTPFTPSLGTGACCQTLTAGGGHTAAVARHQRRPKVAKEQGGIA